MEGELVVGGHRGSSQSISNTLVVVKRRNLTASQNAIAAAEVSTLSEKFTNADRRKLAKTFGVNERYLANARSLVERAPDLAESVKAGSMPLADAPSFPPS